MHSTNKNNFAKAFFLLAILFLGIMIYFYRLGEIPSGFYIDEAMPGYNAYSLLLTGKDEYGKFFPVALRFYGSYNPPLFTYLTIPVIYLLGLNIFSIRFVSALSGLLISLVIYLLLRTSKLVKNKSTSIFTALLSLISPWIILHSRVGYEVSLGLLLFALGILFFWKALEKQKYIIYGFLFLSLSTYAAYAERFLVPMFIVGYVLIFKNKVFTGRGKGYFIKGAQIALLTQIPHFLILFTPAFFPKSNLVSTDLISAQALKISKFLPYTLSYTLSYLREFLSQYFGYFSPRSLFFLPDPDLQRSIPELSVFYFWMIVPYFVGIYALWKNKKRQFSRLILLLIVISPIPAALTRDPFSTHRAFPLVLPLLLIIALGVDVIISKLHKIIWSISFSLLFMISLLLLWRSYFVLLPKERAKVWGYGHEQLAEEIKLQRDVNFVIDQARIKPAYAQLAFFLKVPPKEFQEKVDQDVKENYYQGQEFNSYYNFANVETRNIVWGKDIYKKQVLVGDEFTISEQQAEEHFLEKIFEIRSPVDEIIFVGFKTNPIKKCETDPNNVYCRKIRSDY